MCPACLATAALIFTGATSTGAIAMIVMKNRAQSGKRAKAAPSQPQQPKEHAS